MNTRFKAQYKISYPDLMTQFSRFATKALENVVIYPYYRYFLGNMNCIVKLVDQSGADFGLTTL